MHKSSNWEWSSWPLVGVESCRLGSFSTMVSMGKIFRSIRVGRCGEFLVAFQSPVVERFYCIQLLWDPTTGKQYLRQCMVSYIVVTRKYFCFNIVAS